jgi:ABC-2 type transport system permease protein
MNALAGTGRLFRLALRRDRFVLSAWVLALTVFLAATTHMSVLGLPTQRDVVTETQFMAANPGMRLLSLSAGASVGAYAMSRSYLTVAILAAVMSVLAVVRHTRQNEETGRAELLGAGVVGPSAGVAAAVIVALGANIVLAPLLGLAMIVNGQPAAGSLASGAAIAAVGVAFTGVAALTSQLSSTARGANGLAMAVLAVAFVLSGVGNLLGHADASGLVAYSAWPTWLSPIGWGYEIRPFGGDRWWLLGLFGVLAAVLVAAAGRYAARRDLGRGVLPVQTGPAQASSWLPRPLGLAWRLQRTAFFSWLVGVVGFGLIFGSVSGSARTMEGRAREWYQNMGDSSDMLTAFFTSIIEIAGMMVAIYAVQVLLRMREEETRGRLEPVLAGAVSRPRWVTSYVLTAGLGAIALLVGFAVAMALTAGQVVGGTSGLLLDLTGAALAELPAVLVIMAAVLAVFALLPRWAVTVSWLLLGASILLSPVFASSLRLPQWAMDMSPFAHQKAPALDVDIVAIIALLAVSAVLLAAGLAAFRRRDIVPG